MISIRAPTPHVNADDTSVLCHLMLQLAWACRTSTRWAGRAGRSIAQLEAVLVHHAASMVIAEAMRTIDAARDEVANPHDGHGDAARRCLKGSATLNLVRGMALALTSASKDECCA